MAKWGTCGSFTTKIGKYTVPVKKHNQPSILVFKDNIYAFWTCVYKKKVYGKKRVWGRAQIGLSAGDRFDRMKRERRTCKVKEDRAIYNHFWVDQMKYGENVAYVRPSTWPEIKKWRDLHPDQWKFFLRIID